MLPLTDMISGALLPHSGSGKSNQNALCLIPVFKRQEANERGADEECKFWLSPISLARNAGIRPHDLRHPKFLHLRLHCRELASLTAEFIGESQRRWKAKELQPVLGGE